MIADPKFTFHLKGSAQADLPARATPIRDKARRREIFQQMKDRFEGRRGIDLDEFVEKSPLVSVEFIAP